MIEIRITIEAIISILIEKMKIELRQRQRCGLIPIGLRLEDLSYNQLIKIVEASIFDTLFMLPIDLVLMESNIAQLITEAVKSLSRILKKEEFSIFNKRQTQKIINRVTKFLAESTKTDNFKNN
ncbi:MAG: hypothetical protein QHH13_03630 [Melioribacter sp.]|uniref:hypothetical protein n=1 Tax=Rosettibacter primus TaxID=3111523 RepID=UPI00247CF248|nr:hypothetical protein [Melioribacter sp.]